MSTANLRLVGALIVIAAHGVRGLVGLAWRGLRWLRNHGGKPTWAVLEAALSQGGCSPQTIRVYTRCVDRLLSWGEATGTSVTIPDGVAAYLAAREASGASSDTLRLHLAAARKILDKALDVGATDSLHYPPPGGARDPASTEAVALLFDATETTEERLQMLLLNHCDLRPGQIAGIRRDGVDLHTARLSVQGKSRRWDKPIPLPPVIVHLFRRLLRRKPSSEYVFSSPRFPNRPVSVRTVQTNLARIASRCGVKTTCTAVRRASSVLDTGVVHLLQSGAGPVALAVATVPASPDAQVADPQPETGNSENTTRTRPCCPRAPPTAA